MNTAIIKPEWSPLTIALMVLGFIIFWPVGMAVLAYILWGEYMGGSREKADAWVSRQKHHFKSKRGGCTSRSYSSSTGNAAFDEYRDEQLKRLEEERRKLEEDREAFEEHLANLHKARDREEFDRFMRDRNTPRDTNTDGERQGY
ncbi:DUF2852 domain-containing protein [Pelagibacterium luteolum]|uniref:DUF2852 domain-containing protein n=1 Tax=Pelagibacterium luteolum TaxID=440168 RepID=A0A1G7SLR6_9HYPH|nr:DUF2852 domain-containing protein [Pelagibacterium luteolum]SDG24005.1 Protein of unknown function [Pelagibacterium luteolum]